MKNLIIFGILFLGIFNFVHSKPAENNDLDTMQSDDYYADDESSDVAAANQQMKPSKPISTPKGSKAYFAKPNSTITAVIGKDIVLHCEVINLGDEVVLWYKGENIVANDGNVLLPMYSVDNNTHTLTIINASESSKGEYFCELKPDNKRLYTTVVISREQPVIPREPLVVPTEPLDVVVPESSPSKQNNSGAVLSSCLLSLFLACALQFVVRI